MKATVFDIQRFSVHDGPGIRTTVFMKGCALRCAWCHNPEGLLPDIGTQFFAKECISCGRCGGVRSIENAMNCPAEALRVSGREIDTAELLSEVLRDRAFYSDGGGVTFSGGECLLQADFVAEMLKLLHEEGINTAVDTAGFVPWSNIEKTLADCDLYLYDVKCADPVLHKRYTGADNSLILANLDRLAASGANILARVPVIPSFNDNEAELSAIAEILKKVGITEATMMPYHTLGKSKYETLGMTAPFNTDRTIPKSTLDGFKKIFENRGIKVS